MDVIIYISVTFTDYSIVDQTVLSNIFFIIAGLDYIIFSGIIYRQVHLKNFLSELEKTVYKNKKILTEYNYIYSDFLLIETASPMAPFTYKEIS